MLLPSWLRDLQAIVGRVRPARARPAQRPGRTPCRLAVEQLENRLVPSTSAPLTVVYVESNNPNPGQNAVLAYRSDPADGNLTPLGTFLTGGTGTPNPTEVLGPDDSDQEIVISPDHRFLFAVNSGSNSIAVFDIHSDGSLSLVPGAPFPSGGIQPVSLGLAGNNLYVVNKGDQVPGQASGGSRPNYTGFHVNGNGKLHAITKSTVEVNPGSSPSQALITPDGQFLFGSDLFAQRLDPPPPLPPFIPPFASALEGFQIRPNGRLAQTPDTPRGTFGDTPLPPFVLGLQAHPTEQIIYAGFVAGNQLGVYTYDQAGRLSFAGSVPSAGLGICWIAISPDARYLFTANSTSDSVSAYSIADPLHPVEVQNLELAGPKAPLPGINPTIFDTTPFQLATDPAGHFLYVVNHETAGGTNAAGNALHIIAIGPGGTLTESVGPLFLPVPATANPQGVVVVQFEAPARRQGAQRSDLSSLAAAAPIRAASLPGSTSIPPSGPAAGGTVAEAGPGPVPNNLPAPSSSSPAGAASAPTLSTSPRSRESQPGLTDNPANDLAGGSLSRDLV